MKSDWIFCIFFSFIEINCYSVRCWNSQLVLFFFVWIIFIDFIWNYRLSEK
jgi:hypothetical protein